jgi:hypothetical protein
MDGWRNRFSSDEPRRCARLQYHRFRAALYVLRDSVKRTQTAREEFPVTGDQPPRITGNLPMIGACWLFTHLQLHEVPTSDLPGRWSGWRWYVDKLLEQLLIRCQPIFHSGQLCVRQRNILAQPQEVCFGFEKLRLR